ncbi:MAG TPA: PHP domain-containing protein, partial [Pseudomonadales bacterium]|nr:PHP domain-containing protein [Pseudomonadales bacterium]
MRSFNSPIARPHYVALRCTSNYSFLQSASHPEELVNAAIESGYQGIALTDECSLAGMVKAHVAAKRYNKEIKSPAAPEFKLIVGSEFTTQENICFAAYAPHRQAYGQLSSFITFARKHAEKGSYQCQVKDLRYQMRDCQFILFPDLTITADNPHLQKFIELTAGRVWLGYAHQHHNQQEALLNHANELASLFNLPILAAPHVKMHTPERRALLDTVTAIRLNTSVHNIGYAAAQNGEAYLHPLTTLSADYPEKWLRETARFAESFHYSMDEIRYEYPNELVPPHLTATVYLRQLVEAGAITRWGEPIRPDMRALLEKELGLIAKLKYEYFFLTVHSIVQFAREKKILCQGRGSAANSAVCFCLGITEVDPAKTHVLFERFISEERNEPPDIDVDFEHERREEVIQFIYQKYTRERAALAATVITYKRRSAIRDVGKALGFDPTLIEHL